MSTSEISYQEYIKRRKDFRKKSGKQYDDYCPFCEDSKQYFVCENCNGGPCGKYGCGTMIPSGEYCKKHNKKEQEQNKKQ